MILALLQIFCQKSRNHKKITHYGKLCLSITLLNLATCCMSNCACILNLEFSVHIKLRIYNRLSCVHIDKVSFNKLASKYMLSKIYMYIYPTWIAQLKMMIQYIFNVRQM